MNYKDINLYNYDLDESLIAQHPIKKRDDSKLLVVNKKSGKLKGDKFYNILNYLKKGDVLVLNDTKVLPARIIGFKEKTNAKIEVLLLKEIDNNIWSCLIKPQKRVKKGTIIKFNEEFKCEVNEVYNDGLSEVKFIYEGVFLNHLEKIGTMPLPPYIHEKLLDQGRYQTVYAKNIGSAASPTAGLHFTNELLSFIKEKGIEVVYITLNVGLATFRPVSEKDITKHQIHSELYFISSEAANKLNKAKEEGRRIICVGTTSLRALESNIQKYKEFQSTLEETNIFIYPPYKFLSADGLITNFHLPKSTLIMLVSAFSNIDIIKNAYKYAQDKKYRFFSFGDAMFITDEEM